MRLTREDAQFLLAIINSVNFPGTLIERAYDLKMRFREEIENSVSGPEIPKE